MLRTERPEVPKDLPLPTLLLREFLGTFVLVFVVAFSLLPDTPEVQSVISVAVALVAIECTLQVHLNPAVTLAAALLKKLPWSSVGPYVAVQVFAGLVAGLVAEGVWKEQAVLPQPQAEFHWWQVMVAEVVFTSMMIFVTLNVMIGRPTAHQDQIGLLAIGFAYTACGFAARPMTGAAFNPAVSLGISVVRLRSDLVLQALLCTGYQVLGSAIAFGLYTAVRPAGMTGTGLESEPKLASKLAAEFIATLLFTLTVCLNVIGHSAATPLASACALAALTASIQDVSGGYLNPSVTLAAATTKNSGLTFHHCYAYIAFQATAGLLAGILYMGLYRAKSFPLGPKDPLQADSCYLLEFTFTALMALVHLSTVLAQRTHKTRNNFGFLAVGACYLACTLPSGRIASSYFNPAIALAVGIADALNFGTFYYVCTYIGWQIAGGLAASIVFMLLHGSRTGDQKAT